MNIEQLLILLLIGGVAGWLAGILMKGKGLGIVPNIIIGWIGSFIGGAAFNFLGISSSGLLGTIITATIGACILLAVVSALKKM